MNVKVGTAPDSWGVWFPDDPLQIPWQRFLDEVVESGYEWIELGPYGYLPTDLPTLSAELDKRGLKVCGTFAMAHLEDPSLWSQLEKQVLDAGALLAGLGAESLVLIDDVYTDLFTGEPTGRPTILDESGWRRLIDTTHRVADLARDEFGLSLVFHNHVDTHVDYEDQIEALLEQTDPNRVALCLDIGHLAYRGSDAVSFMRRHHERIPYFHIKDIDKDVQRQVEEGCIPFAEAVKMDMFVEPAKGAVDFPALCDVLQDIEFDGWAIVEQDLYPTPFDKPLPIAKSTRDYLRDIGMG